MIDFPIYITDFFLKYPHILRKNWLAYEKIYLVKTALHHTANKFLIDFFWILPKSSVDFTRQNTGKDAKISRRRACEFDYLTARQKKVIRTRLKIT